MKPIEERVAEYVDSMEVEFNEENREIVYKVIKPIREALIQVGVEFATEQKEHDIKVLSKVYADLLSAKGYDIGTINSELARLQKEIKED